MYVGIDIGKLHHQVAFLDHNGKDLHPSFPFDNTEEGFARFFKAMDTTTDGQPVVVGMEATGHYWLNLYTALLARDIEAHVINPIQTDAIRRMNIRKTKTDAVDCRYIAQVIRIGEYSDVALQTTDIAELKQLCRYRYELVDSVTVIKNQIIGLVDRIFPEYHTLFSDIFGKTSMELLKRYTTAEAISKLSIKRLSDLLIKYSRGAFGQEKAQEIKYLCQHTIGLGGLNPAFVFQLQLQLQQIEFMQTHISLVEEQIQAIYSRFPCYLHTIKGMGGTSAAVIMAEIGDISNFDHPKKLVAFAGIDPSVYQSGNFTATHAKMSKRGSPYLRRALWNVAETASRSNPVLKEFYQKKRAEGKDHRTAIGATARKLCYIIYAILRDQTPFKADFMPTVPS
jgi:transposase